MQQKLFCVLLAGLFLPGLSAAQLNVDQSSISFDTDSLLQLNASLALADDTLLSWTASAGYTVKEILTDNSNADLTAYSDFNSQITATFDVTLELPGSIPEEPTVIITPQDVAVVYYDQVSQSNVFSKITIPPLAGSNARIDALSVGNDGFLISLDRTTLLGDDSSTTAEPADVFTMNKGQGHPLFFDASSKFLSRGKNIDAISFDVDSQLLYLSFDTGGRIGSERFDANSILVFDHANDTLVIWDNASNGLSDAGLSKGTNLNAMMLKFIPKPETIFIDGFE